MRQVALSSREASRIERYAIADKLQSVAGLAGQDLDALSNVALSIRVIPAGQDIVRAGDVPFASFVLLDGFAVRYKTLLNGKRQILSFHPGGDIPNLQDLHLDVVQHSIAALSPLMAGFVRHHDLRRLSLHHPRIAALLWQKTSIEAAICREWLIRLGHSDAPLRIAHFLCEIYARLEALGLAESWTVRLPFKQVQIGEALGLTAVHVNRTLAKFKANGLLLLSRGQLTILDWDRLRTVADFDPSYLHLDRIGTGAFLTQRSS